ncbi:unnamed protein product, partial [Clonostachys byssicola]
MVRGLGCPSTFLTFSAADIHWDSLQKHLPRYDEWRGAPRDARFAITTANLRDNPLIVAYHFYKRVTTFIDTVLKPKFDVADSWFRFEWQAGGSTHLHGLFWFRNGTVVDFLNDPENRRIFEQFWGVHVSATAHEAASAQGRDPLAVPSADPTFQALSDINNRVQRHRCTDAAEQKMETYKNVAKTMLPKVNSSSPVTSLVAQCMNKLAAERDWSAMEVCHLLLNLPLQEATRRLVSVDCRHPAEQPVTEQIQETTIRRTQTIYDKYLARSHKWEHVSYFEFLTRIDHNSNPWRYFPRAQPRILNCFPRYRSDPQSEDYVSYCRVRLLLHHPHWLVEELKTINGIQFASFRAAFGYCQRIPLKSIYLVNERRDTPREARFAIATANWSVLKLLV